MGAGKVSDAPTSPEGHQSPEETQPTPNEAAGPPRKSRVWVWVLKHNTCSEQAGAAGPQLWVPLRSRLPLTDAGVLVSLTRGDRVISELRYSARRFGGKTPAQSSKTTAGAKRGTFICLRRPGSRWARRGVSMATMFIARTSSYRIPVPCRETTCSLRSGIGGHGRGGPHPRDEMAERLGA